MAQLPPVPRGGSALLQAPPPSMSPGLPALGAIFSSSLHIMGPLHTYLHGCLFPEQQGLGELCTPVLPVW